MRLQTRQRRAPMTSTLRRADRAGGGRHHRQECVRCWSRRAARRCSRRAPPATDSTSIACARVMRGTSSIAKARDLAIAQQARQLGFFVRVDEGNQDRAFLHRLHDRGIGRLDRQHDVRVAHHLERDRRAAARSCTPGPPASPRAPAPACRWSCAPSLASLSATAGTSATRRSCGRVSLSTAILTGMNAPPNKGRNCGCLVPTGQHAHASARPEPRRVSDDRIPQQYARSRPPVFRLSRPGPHSGRRPQQRGADDRRRLRCSQLSPVAGSWRGALGGVAGRAAGAAVCWWLSGSMPLLPLYLPPIWCRRSSPSCSANAPAGPYALDLASDSPAAWRRATSRRSALVLRVRRLTATWTLSSRSYFNRLAALASRTGCCAPAASTRARGVARVWSLFANLIAVPDRLGFFASNSLTGGKSFPRSPIAPCSTSCSRCCGHAAPHQALAMSKAP